jgi:hypothetical protein
MITLLSLKKVLIVLGAFTIYFIYFNRRFNRRNRRKDPRKLSESYYSSYIETGLDPMIWKAIQNYRTKKRSIDIKYSNQNSFIKNSIILMENYNLNSDNFNEKRLLNICEEDDFKCETSNLRTFIYAYFQEVKGDKEIFQIYDGKNGSTYLLKEDSEGILKEEEGEETIKALGLMLSLALVTETFLDINFSSIFLAQFSEVKYKYLLDEELPWYDDEQYKIYSLIKYGNWGSFGYNPNSSKPFRKSHDAANKNGGIILYRADDYPIDLAAIRIFFDPFEISTKFINQSTLKFFGKSIVHLDSFSQKEEFNDNQIGIQFYTIFKEKCCQFDAVQWRDHSIYDYSTRMFWKALNNFNFYDQVRIFRKITGLEWLPEFGFERLPKTLLKPSDGSEIKFVPFKFELWVPAYSSLEEMQKLLNKFI